MVRYGSISFYLACSFLSLPFVIHLLIPHILEPHVCSFIMVFSLRWYFPWVSSDVHDESAWIILLVNMLSHEWLMFHSGYELIEVFGPSRYCDCAYFFPIVMRLSNLFGWLKSGWCSILFGTCIHHHTTYILASYPYWIAQPDPLRHTSSLEDYSYFF